MADIYQVQIRSGTAAQVDAFTGAAGELTYDTDTGQLRVHDGSTVGGLKMIQDNGGAIALSTVDVDGGTIDGTVIGGSSPAAGSFTSLSATSLSVPSINGPSIGDTLANTGVFTSLSATSLSVPSINGPSIGDTLANTGVFTSLSATSFSVPSINGPSIGNTLANTGAFTSLTATGAFTSLGIDDNASSRLIQLDTNGVAVGPSVTASTNVALTLGRGMVITNAIAGAPSATGAVIDFSASSARYSVNGSHIFYVGGPAATEALRINSSGNFGIGTAPSERLDVSGNIRIRSGQLQSHTGEVLAFGVNGGTEVARFDTSGNFSIGGAAVYPAIVTVIGSSGEVVAGNTTDSLATFTNDGNASISLHGAATYNATIYFGTTGAGGNTKGRIDYDFATDALAFFTNNNEAMRIATTGITVEGTAIAKQGMPIVTNSANTKTLALTDSGSYIRFSNTTITVLTIPTNATVAFPTGTEVTGTGVANTVSIANSAGVTLNSKESLVTASAGGAFFLKKVGTNEWDLHGALE